MGWLKYPLLLLLSGGFGCLGCKKIPADRDAVTAVHMSGVPRSHRAEIAAGLATQETGRFLGLFSGVYEWQTLNESALAEDIKRIERGLRRRGYYEARVTAARVLRVGENRVRVEIEVDPGPRVTLGHIETEGLAALPFDAAINATRALDLELGDPFDEDAYEQAKLDLARALADSGYAHVEVKGHAEIDLSTQKANINLVADPGPRATFGPIVIEGLDNITEGPVRSALMLSEGEQYSRKKLDEARAALFRLGAFSQVEVIPHLSDGQSRVIPVTVRVKEAALKSISAGAGASLDVLHLQARGRIGWVHRNFLGGLRKFSISTRPALTFFPTRVGNWTAPTNLLPENSLSVSLQQPAFLEGRTEGVLETGYNVYPLIYPLPEGVEPENETVVGYNEITARAGIERQFFLGRLPVNLSFNWRANFPFTYQGQTADGLAPVIVSYPELEFVYDYRDDPISPSKGLLVQNNLQVGLPVLGSEVLDLRIRPELRTYLPLDFKKKLILATRFTAGFLWTNSYGNALSQAGANVDYSDPSVIRDQHTLLFRAFYSGGPSSNRGYPYQRVGPQGAIGFLVPTGTECQGTPADLPSSCIRPLGGFTLWEASLELRYRLRGPWGLVAFVDTSDVGFKGESFDFSAPHLSVGPGLRYASPVGPIRIDVGFRVPGLQKLDDNPNELPDVAEVSPYVDQRWWQSFALNILIGEAF